MSKVPGTVWYTWVAYRDNPDEGKRRPVVCLGHDTCACITLSITSKLHHPGSYILLDWELADLDRPSAVRLDTVLSMSESDLTDYIGRLSERDLENLMTEFRLYQITRNRGEHRRPLPLPVRWRMEPRFMGLCSRRPPSF